MRIEASTEVLRRHRDPVQLLTSDEVTRARRLLRREDREDYVAAHVLARELVAELVGSAPSHVRITQECPHCGARGHGRPSVASSAPDQPGVSWSHSSGRVAAAAVMDAQLGIDVERLNGVQPDRDLVLAALPDDEARTVLDASDPERAFLALWTRKEALVKMGSLTLDDATGLTLAAMLASSPTVSLNGWFDPAAGVAAALAVDRQQSSDQPPALFSD